jgi:carbon-monoxide dehydrogenase medium subunit
MKGFELARPASLAEAIALLADGDPTVRAFSGGTALMLMMKTGVFQPTRLVHLGGIEEVHSAILATEDGGLKIGALASLRQVECSPVVADIAPVLVRAMKRLSNVRVRNVARIGGNLAHGDPHMDLPPVLSALGATVGVAGLDGARRIPVESLFSGYYETVLTPGELIVDATVPPQSGWSASYVKVTTRSADDWPALGVAVALRLADGVVAESRIVVSAATEKLTRLPAAEAAILGAEPTTDVFARAGEAAAAEAETIDDARGSAAYKTALLRVHVRRALDEARHTGAMQ